LQNGRGDVITVVRWQDRRWGKGKGMTRPREYIHTRMNVHGGNVGVKEKHKRERCTCTLSTDPFQSANLPAG
jgi:hypothetical protein